MGKDEAPLAQFYEKLSSEQKKSLSNAVTEKLQGIIGGYGELGVLVEYISVMLQSSRPKETIQSELEAFLQDESGPFTTWLCEKLAKMTEGSTGKRRRKKDPKDPKDPKETKEVKDSTDAARKAKKEKKAAAAAAANAAAAAAAAAAAPVAAPAERRSRSRKRRRRSAAAAATAAPAPTGPGTAATLTAADRKAKLTPNVDYIQEPRGEDATRWSFRAETHQGHAPPPGSPVRYVPPSYPPGPPGYPASRPPFTPAPHAPHAPHAHHAPHVPYAPSHASPMMHPHAAHGQPYFTPKKWKVARKDTVVRKTERLDSDEVQKLQEGEIVEQVAPSFTTENGIVRVQIRHPSSPLFPKPIGWVTQDASAAGGPKFLEPGPEPMKTPGPPAVSGSSWRPSYWRPPRAPPPRPYGARSFQHLTWTPSG